MNNIKKLLDIMEAQRVKGNYMALGLMSDPGLSKTSQVKQWTEETPAPKENTRGRREYFEFITSQRMPSEISGMPMPNNETKKMDVYDYDYLLQMQDGDVLAFDEFTNGNIMTLNACLTLIQERHMLSGKDLPSIIIVAMGNPQGQCDLLPQTKQRFIWYDVKFDRQTWAAYIKKRYNFTASKDLLDIISHQYSEGFDPGYCGSDYNYWTPRTAENYLRIAMDLPKDDDFWSVILRMPQGDIDAIYATLASSNSFLNIQEQCLEFLHNLEKTTFVEEDDLRYLTLLEMAVSLAKRWKGLAEILDNIGTYGKPGRMLVEYLDGEEVLEIE